MVRTHPDSAYLFPGLEGVSVAEMAKSEAVNSIGKKAAGIAQFMVANINEPSVVKSIVSSKKMSNILTYRMICVNHKMKESYVTNTSPRR